MSDSISSQPEFLLLDGILQCDPDKVRAALLRGASVSCRDRDAPKIWRLASLELRGSFPLYEAALFTSGQRGSKNGREIVSLLLDAGAPIDMANDKGYVALHQAALSNNAEVVSVLIERGADINARSLRGYTPLHTAVFGHAPQALCSLLSAGARVDLVNDKGLDVMAYAEKLVRSDMLALLHSHASASLIRKLHSMAGDVVTFELCRSAKGP